MVALAVYGASDAVSVVIRHSLVQTRTPNDMLGRVHGGQLRCSPAPRARSASSAPARSRPLFGAFTSVLVGGIGAVAVALLWMRLFPEIAKIDKIQGQHLTCHGRAPGGKIIP